MNSRAFCGAVMMTAFLFAANRCAGSRMDERTPIEVQVEVSEVNNTKAAQLGIEWLDSINVAEASPSGLVAVGAVGRTTNIRADLHFLVEQGAAELLANPNLITDSGTTATFHAGGQIPYITSSSLGTTHVEFKPYGVMLSIKPYLLESGLIQMTIQASVSAPDQTNGVILTGNAVPALFEREVSSHVTIEPESTMTLAGLVQTQKEERMQGVPILQRIPVLGALFRWKKTNFRRTTIIMFVTPKVVDS